MKGLEDARARRRGRAGRRLGEPTVTTTSACRRRCGSSCKGVLVVVRGMLRIWRGFCRVIRMVLFVLGKGVDGRG